MLIALLALLGVDLSVVVLLLGFLLVRKRWVKRQPGSFRGEIRVAGGELDGLRPKWSRGYGRWVGDVLVWTRAPFLFRHAFVAGGSLNDERPARPGEVKRLGDEPVVIELTTHDATVMVAASDGDRERLLGAHRPTTRPVDTRPADIRRMMR
jgi:hypothetical protein